MTFFSRQKRLYLLLIVVCLALSMAGVYYGAYHTDKPPPYDGGRGGAIAVAIAFAILFARRNYATRLFNKRVGKDFEILQNEIAVFKKDQPFPDVSPEKFHIIRRHIVLIVNRMNIEADGQTTQNVALTMASCIGTVFWGFGDWFAGQLKIKVPDPQTGIGATLALTLALAVLCAAVFFIVFWILNNKKAPQDDGATLQ